MARQADAKTYQLVELDEPVISPLQSPGPSPLKRDQSRPAIALDDVFFDPNIPLPTNLLNLTGQVEMIDCHGHVSFGTDFSVGQDAWGAATVAIVRNMTVIDMKRAHNLSYEVNLMRMSTSLSAMLFNLGLQFGLLFIIGEYLVEPAVSDIQQIYNAFLEDNFQDGVFVDDLWDSYEKKDQVCSIIMLNKTFYYSMMLLWVLTQMQEIRGVERLMRMISNLRGCNKNSEMLHFSESGSFAMGGKCHIKAMTIPARVCVYTLVCLPRIAIACYLLVLGCRWLAASDDFGEMILNSLALSFVIGIDELIYDSILPVATRKQVEETMFFFEEGPEPKTLRQVEASEWSGYKRSLIAVVASVCFLFAYGEYFQSVLPPNLGHLNQVCRAHNQRSRELLCHKFAFSWHGDCYAEGHAFNLHGIQDE
ncbi:unnamed protein product [Polarella glacialis]|uniref:Uncharacterized protein n=1 Tax=Polarella glacialis TaxID=89957 RepID=A0A813IGM0_POLGL|nr:unnamed protein product [Polarella glacialis]